MIDPCTVDLTMFLWSMAERHCTGDMNPLCRELIEWLGEMRSGSVYPFGNIPS